MMGAFAIVGVWPMIAGESPSWWSLIAAAAILAVTLFAPALLQPFNRLWMAFGHRLHIVVTPVVMGFLFYATVTPMALLMKLFGKTPISVRFDRAAKSYWIEREPPGPAPASMKNQF